MNNILALLGELHIPELIITTVFVIFIMVAIKIMVEMPKVILGIEFKEPLRSEINHDEIISLIDEHIKGTQFNSAIVLMEQQRLKKLEIKELELRLALLEFGDTKESPLANSFQGELL